MVGKFGRGLALAIETDVPLPAELLDLVRNIRAMDGTNVFIWGGFVPGNN